MLLFITPPAINSDKFYRFLFIQKRLVTFSQHFLLLILTNGEHDLKANLKKSNSSQ